LLGEHPMEPLEKHLLDLLHEELRIYREIQSVKHAEAKALVSFSAKALDETNKALEQCLTRAAVTEVERRKVVLQIVGSARNHENEPTLRDLAPMLSPEARQKIEPLAKEITSLCVEIGRLQFANTGVIERSLGYLRDLVEQILKRAQFPSIAYNATGTFVSGREAGPGIMDRTA
jgi:hypothetical protein